MPVFTEGQDIDRWLATAARAAFCACSRHVSRLISAPIMR